MLTTRNFSGGLILLTQNIVKNYSRLISSTKSHNGCLTIRKGYENHPFLVTHFGRCELDEVRKTHAMSLEKGERLGIFENDLSSFQSRNPDVSLLVGLDQQKVHIKGMLGGAIRLRKENLILSFDGISELGDEAVVLVVSILNNWLTLEEANQIIKISNNNYFKPLLEMSSL